jgi:hypothetical protein
MKAIRENLFVLVLAAAVLAVGGILLAVRSHFAGEADAQVALRKDVSDRASPFRGQGNLVNERIVAAEANRGRLIVEEANRVGEFQTRLNQPPYPVLWLPLMDGDRVRGMVNAFPYDANVYKNETLTVKFIQRHPAETASRIQVLQPTQVPTEDDINAELRRLLASEGAAAAPAAAGGWPAAGAERGADPAGHNRKKADDYAVFQRATRGRIYVDNAVTLEITFKPTETVASDADLWRKQYKLWIATDVIAGIKAANDEVLGKVSPRDRNVCNSAVKRWVSLTVRDTYSAKGEAPGAAIEGQFSPAPEDRRSAPPPWETAPPPDEFGGRGRGAGWPGGGMVHRPTEAPTPVQITAETCTGRYTDTEKDVVQYTFQVVMPTRHIPLLMRKLTQDRMHTIVAWRADEAPREPGYYYSNDPVMKVIFTCEAIFLTSWERDLVPPGFLNTLPPSALREKDKLRLPKP